MGAIPPPPGNHPSAKGTLPRLVPFTRELEQMLVECLGSGVGWDVEWRAHQVLDRDGRAQGFVNQQADDRRATMQRAARDAASELFFNTQPLEGRRGCA